ncbi:hypothetical protein [Pseudonocardia sp. NPDC049154]|uniref:hypothetical protein n=1 Tax=Pseudonocardia sp. NPDC049154 TaxID=3155501 RepID=UPI0033D618B2
MTWDRAFLTFTRLREDRHIEYNAWHQLDHLPENLRLPGVVWGDRWVCTPDCLPWVTGSDADAGHQYAVVYWFRTPLDESVRDWTELNQRAHSGGDDGPSSPTPTAARSASCPPSRPTPHRGCSSRRGRSRCVRTAAST